MGVTLLEINLPDSVFNAPFSGDSPGDGASGTRPRVGGDAGGPPIKGPVAAVIVLLALALLARYLRSRDDGAEPGPGGTTA